MGSPNFFSRRKGFKEHPIRDQDHAKVKELFEEFEKAEDISGLGLALCFD
jgi:hypothetical protein